MIDNYERLSTTIECKWSQTTKILCGHYFNSIYAEKFQKPDGIETLFQNKILLVHKHKHPRQCQLSVIRL